MTLCIRLKYSFSHSTTCSDDVAASVSVVKPRMSVKMSVTTRSSPPRTTSPLLYSSSATSGETQREKMSMICARSASLASRSARSCA